MVRWIQIGTDDAVAMEFAGAAPLLGGIETASARQARVTAAPP